jgi:hypothetical protein
MKVFLPWIVLIVAVANGEAVFHQKLTNATTVKSGRPDVAGQRPAVTNAEPASGKSTDSSAGSNSNKNLTIPATNLRSAENLRNENIARCLAVYYTKPIDAEQLRPWSIMHGLIAYGRRAQVIHQGRAINAVDFLCRNEIGHDMQLLGLENNKLIARMGPGVQGHPCQFLAILAQCDVPLDQRLHVEGREFTVKDLLEYEQRTCHTGTELTFKLIAMSHYLEPDAQWANTLGQHWDMQRLIREELKQPIGTGACGGTHRLMAYTFAVAQLRRHQWPIGGEWHNAARMLDVYVDRAWKMQNLDGTFSTEFFERPDHNADRNRQLYATGHVLEWLVCTLPDSQLGDPRLTAAVDSILKLMLTAPNYELDVGPRGHALHALAIYENRVYGGSSEYAQLLAHGIPYVPVVNALVEEPETVKANNNIYSTSFNNNNGMARPVRRAIMRRR